MLSNKILKSIANNKDIIKFEKVSTAEDLAIQLSLISLVVIVFIIKLIVI